jgi:hypothetical protein
MRQGYNNIRIRREDRHKCNIPTGRLSDLDARELPKWIYYDKVRLVVINREIPENKRV